MRCAKSCSASRRSNTSSRRRELFDYLRRRFSALREPGRERESGVVFKAEHSLGTRGTCRPRWRRRSRCGSTGEQPIFLLAAGWRSGSTLLQRLLMSDPAVLLWGEPYDECGIVQALAQTVVAVQKWLAARGLLLQWAAKPKTLTGDWIANLFPSAGRAATRPSSVFRNDLRRTRRRAGASRWGTQGSAVQRRLCPLSPLAVPSSQVRVSVPTSARCLSFVLPVRPQLVRRLAG